MGIGGIDGIAGIGGKSGMLPVEEPVPVDVVDVVSGRLELLESR